MKVLGLLILMVGFAFPVAGQAQIMTCGHLLDRQYIQDYCQGENPREEECGVRISDDQRFSPWFELAQTADGEPNGLIFIDGLANLFRFDPERVDLIRLKFSFNTLTLKLSVFSGHHGRTVLLSTTLFRQPARELDGSFFQGTLNIVLNYESLKPLPGRQNSFISLAPDVYNMPFACVTNSPKP